MINKVKRTYNVHRTYKRIIGTSIACLSMMATITVGSDIANANVDILQPKIVQAVAYAPIQVETIAEKIKTESVKYVGVPYVWGGNTTRGFDCSGFTKHVFQSAGINLPRVASDQAVIDRKPEFAGRATAVTNKNDLKAGDLIFFSSGSGSSVTHVGIALEDNKYIHASSSSRKVVIANRSGSYYNGAFVKGVRVN